MSRSADSKGTDFRLRAGFVLLVMVLGAGGLVGKAVHLQLVKGDFLVRQGDARIMRKVQTGANRGSIVDRNGTLLAISTPVVSVYADPQELGKFPDRWPELANVLGRKRDEFAQRVSSSQESRRLWLARQLQPADGQAVSALDVPGVHLTREQKRYYPAGEVVGHVVGLTNIEDEGQEGAELAFESVLKGDPGLKRVYQDNLGRRVEDIENIRTARPGRDLVLSVDMRIQYVAYRELKAAVEANHAHAGSLVIVDVATGEILAVANLPSFNPNSRAKLTPAMFRNRAVTDPIEPGSSIKPFVVAAALESGRFNAASTVDVSAGYVKIGNRVIEDEHRNGVLDLAGVLAKSSNVGMVKISQVIDRPLIWSTLTGFGFGSVTGGQFKGESGGVLSNFGGWSEDSTASLSYGYGLSVTPLQLAHAYATLGAMGVLKPLTILRRGEAVGGSRVMSVDNARTLIDMLEFVVKKEGTGTKAAIPGYRIAGKTGTAKKSDGSGSYFDHRYIALFGGVAPASNPRIAAVVVIDDPADGRYYGGDIAAPVFAKVVGSALRLMGVAPDAATGPSDPTTGVSTVVQR